MVDFILTGKEVAEHLERILGAYGAPKVVRRDDGPEFKSKAVSKVIERWGIEERAHKEFS